MLLNRKTDVMASSRGGCPRARRAHRAVQTTQATARGHTPLVSTIKERTPPEEVATTPTKTMKVRAMPTCTTRRGRVIGPHAHRSVGRQAVDDQDNTRRSGAIGPHAHGNAARHVVDDLIAEGSGQQKP